MSTKDDVFNYVMNSPEDTNPAVLRSLLNGIEEGGAMEDFVITYTVSSEDNYYYIGSMDKEWEDIVEAYSGGKRVLFRLFFPRLYEGGGEWAYNLPVTSDVFLDGELDALCFTSFIYPLDGDYEGTITATIYEGVCQVNKSTIPYSKDWQDVRN